MTSTQPFRRREALARGTTPHQLAGPRFQRWFRDIYDPSGVPDTVARRAQAALRILPVGSYASHHTAISLWGGCPPASADTHLSTPSGTRSVRRGLRSHRAPATPDVRRRGGLPLSSPEQAYLDLACVGVGLIDLVVAGDSLVAAKVTTPEQLIAAAATSSRRGCRLARRAAALIRVGVDSATETRLRLLVVLAGLPEPEVNHILRRPNGEWDWRFDLSYPALQLAIEYDGDHHRTDRRQRARDLRRREELERQGWTFIVITADDLYNHPAETLQRIWTALTDRGAHRLPVRRHPAWAQNFRTR